MRECWRLHIMSIENPVEQVLKSAGAIAGGRRLLDQLSGACAADGVVLGAGAADRRHRAGACRRCRGLSLLPAPVCCGALSVCSRFVIGLPPGGMR